MPYDNSHKEKSRLKILGSATELFSRYGFNKVSIGQIMKTAKMTHGAFYAHFESKEALFKATFMETLRNSRAARLVKGPLSVEHLTSLVTHYWNLYELGKHKNNPGPESILFNEANSDNQNVKVLFEQSYQHLKRIVEVRLFALSKLKRLPIEADREKIAEKSRVILSLVVGAVVVAKTIPQQEERNKILRAAQSQVLTLLGVEPGSQNEQEYNLVPTTV